MPSGGPRPTGEGPDMDQDVTTEPLLRLPLSRRVSIRWQHRHVDDPELWELRVSFDELIAANGLV